MNNYVIINADDIQSRIDELENYQDKGNHIKEISVLKRVLSNSIPLIPEIEKAYFEGECYGVAAHGYINKKDYIAQLKLGI